MVGKLHDGSFLLARLGAREMSTEGIGMIKQGKAWGAWGGGTSTGLLGWGSKGHQISLCREHRKGCSTGQEN